MYEYDDTQQGKFGGKFGDNHKVKLGKKRSKTNGVKLSKMASNLWVSLGALALRLRRYSGYALLKLTASTPGNANYQGESLKSKQWGTIARWPKRIK